MGRFHIVITPEEIIIFQICILYLKIDELSVVLIYNITYFGQELALHRTPEKQTFLSGPYNCQIQNSQISSDQAINEGGINIEQK